MKDFYLKSFKGYIPITIESSKFIYIHMYPYFDGMVTHDLKNENIENIECLRIVEDLGNT
jgi:exo-beta-1,3-glucanase (GH17 family)